jgi:acetyl esterase/lipase
MSSLANRLVIAGAFATRRRRHYATESSAAAHAARAQRRGPAKPPPGLARRASLSRTEEAGLPVWTIAPAPAPESGAERSGARILYLHGSGYVSPISRFHWTLLGELRERTGAQITVPLYGLAPNHTWREAYASLLEIYERLSETGEPLVVMGDSAGGALALGLTMACRDRGLRSPGRVVVISPGLDATLSNPAIAEVAPRDPILMVPGLQATCRWWAGGDALSRYEISPINGDWSRLPAIDILMGTRDILMPDCRALMAAVAGRDWPITLHEFPDAFHVWPAIPQLPESRAAFALIARLVSDSTMGTADADER